MDRQRRARWPIPPTTVGVATIVRQDGDEIAAILHEPDVPLEVVQLGARITAGQLDAELATARARGRAEAVRVATAALVQAGDRAALVLAAEMDDGPLPRLERLAARLRADPTAVAETAKELQEVTANVRALSHGLVPRELEEGGLAVVLERSVRGRAAPAARGRDHRVPARVRRPGRDRRRKPPTRSW